MYLDLMVSLSRGYRCTYRLDGLIEQHERRARHGVGRQYLPVLLQQELEAGVDV